MKRVISLLLAVIILSSSLVLLASCGEQQKIVKGTCSICGKECNVPADAPQGWIAVCEECDQKIADEMFDTAE